jgi:hypothetical protein
MRTSRLALAAATVFVFSAARAQTEQGLASAILNCAAVADEKAQLACYNGIAVQLKTAQASAPAATLDARPLAAPQDVAQVPKQEGGSWYNPSTWFGSNETPRPARPIVGSPRNFGSENMPEPSSGPQPLDHITAKVASATYNYFRRFTLTLDNGQVWRQNESDTRVARFDDNGTETVTISRGFLNAFSLAIAGQYGTYQVKRIK